MNIFFMQSLRVVRVISPLSRLLYELFLVSHCNLQVNVSTLISLPWYNLIISLRYTLYEY